MTRSRPFTFLAGAAVIPLAALAVAGCGGNGGNATASKPAPKSPTAPPAVVKVAHSGLGKVLVDSQGRTLYLFTKDSGTTSACTGACATAWPPLRTTGKPIAGSGANASLVGSTTRSDGTSQVTYNGHPLYLFVKDTKPGDTNGEGKTAFGGSWFAVSATGKRVSPAPPAPKPAAPAPKPAAPAPQPAAPAPQAAPPAPKAAPAPQNNGIPQNGGGDGDSDNNGGPDDGDGGI